MTYAVFDFEAIAKGARLKAMDGTPQSVMQPMTVATLAEFDPYGMYLAGAGSCGSVTLAQADLPISVGAAAYIEAQRAIIAGTFETYLDTAPSEWSAPDFDPA